MDDIEAVQGVEDRGQLQFEARAARRADQDLVSGRLASQVSHSLQFLGCHSNQSQIPNKSFKEA